MTNMQTKFKVFVFTQLRDTKGNAKS